MIKLKYFRIKWIEINKNIQIKDNPKINKEKIKDPKPAIKS